MTLQKAATSRRPLKINHPIGGVRPIAELFILKDGSDIAFADLGWNEPMNPTHPFHIVNGRLEGEGPWRIGDAKIVIVDEQDDLIMDFLSWWGTIRKRNPEELRKKCKSSIEEEFSVSLAE